MVKSSRSSSSRRSVSCENAHANGQAEGEVEAVKQLVNSDH